jgi:uncharacterized protein
MARLFGFALLFLGANALFPGFGAWGAPSIPELHSPVEDLAGLFSPAETNQLRSEALGILRKTGAQIQVLTIPDLQGEPIEEFSIHVAEKWKLGDNKRDDGLLLLISRKEHGVRLEVGRGLEGVFTDLDTNREIEEILKPRFAQGRFFEGVEAFYSAALAKLDAESSGTPRQSFAPPRAHHEQNPVVVFCIIILCVILFVVDWILKSHPVARAGAFAGVAAPFSLLSFSHPAWGVTPLLDLLLPLFAFGLGLVGLGFALRVIFNILEVAGIFGGGNNRGGDSGWGGGGGSFSGGGSSGTW